MFNPNIKTSYLAQMIYICALVCIAPTVSLHAQVFDPIAQYELNRSKNVSIASAVQRTLQELDKITDDKTKTEAIYTFAEYLRSQESDIQDDDPTNGDLIKLMYGVVNVYKYSLKYKTDRNAETCYRIGDYFLDPVLDKNDSATKYYKIGAYNYAGQLYADECLMKIKDYDTLIKNYPKSKLYRQVWINKANLTWSSNPEKTIEIYNEYFSKYIDEKNMVQDDIWILTQRAECYIKLKQYENALKDYNKFLSLWKWNNSKKFEVLVGIAEIYEEEKAIDSSTIY
ncbi:MAG: hypothetical protein Q7U71_09250, partial [bacterium]|nr:hypothetical protein [bacterium]